MATKSLCLGTTVSLQQGAAVRTALVGCAVSFVLLPLPVGKYLLLARGASKRILQAVAALRQLGIDVPTITPRKFIGFAAARRAVRWGQGEYV